MPDDLTIPGPPRLRWDGYMLYLGALLLGGVLDVQRGERPWFAWLYGNSEDERLHGSYDTETAARAALVAAVREAING